MNKIKRARARKTPKSRETSRRCAVASGSVGLSLNGLQRAALAKAMQADQQQFMIDACTPQRGYAFPMDHTVRVVEMIINAPATKQRLNSQNTAVSQPDQPLPPT